MAVDVVASGPPELRGLEALLTSPPEWCRLSGDASIASPRPRAAMHSPLLWRNARSLNEISRWKHASLRGCRGLCARADDCDQRRSCS